MVKDCFKFAKGCEECQKHNNIQYVSIDELHSIAKPRLLEDVLYT